MRRGNSLGGLLQDYDRFRQALPVKTKLRPKPVPMASDQIYPGTDVDYWHFLRLLVMFRERIKKGAYWISVTVERENVRIKKVGG